MGSLKVALETALAALNKRSLEGSVEARQALYPFQQDDKRIELLIHHLNSDNSLTAVIESTQIVEQILAEQSPVEGGEGSEGPLTTEGEEQTGTTVASEGTTPTA